MNTSLSKLSLADVMWKYFSYVKFALMLVGMWSFLFFFRGCSMDFIPQDNHQMAPSYTGGNMVIFSNPLIHNKATGLEKGDAVIYGDPAARGESTDMMFLGRVIAFGGDRIKVEKGEVYVAGNKVTEAGYLSNANREDFTLDEMVIPAGHVYLLVDNRGLYTAHRYKAYARDSRHFGPISEAAIKAKITSKWKYSGGGN